jgi:hypothetical protein
LKFDKGGVWLWPITDRQPTTANFFITHVAPTPWLEHFGRVVEKGMDVSKYYYFKMIISIK